jgi:hypothetical protein
VRERRRAGRKPPPDGEDQDNTVWKLLWVLVGAVTFIVVMAKFAERPFQAKKGKEPNY